MSWRFDGADVAHYQDEAGALINFDQLAVGSSHFFFATKNTQRNNFTDPTCVRHRAEALRVGFRWVGVYHWQSPVVEASIEAQAAYYLAKTGALRVGEMVLVDAEQSGITEPESYRLLNLIEDVTQRPSAMYGGVSTAGGQNWRSSRIRMSRFGPRAMFLAAYMTQAALAAKLIQLGIQDLEAHANQWGSDGILADGTHVPGVVGRCDKNQINNPSVLDACCGYTTQTQEDSDMITINDIYKDVDSPGDKYVLVSQGYFRPASAVELKLLGIPLTLDLGKPVSKADRDALAALIPPSGGTFGPMTVTLSGSTSLSGTATPK